MIGAPAGVVGDPPDPKPLRSVSPSQMQRLRSCALSAVWSAARVPPTLPQFPAARLGTVAHKLIEEASGGQLADVTEHAIGTRWDELVATANAVMGASWLERHLVPMQNSVPDYEVRRIQAVRLAIGAGGARSVSKVAAPERSAARYELAVSTPDGKVFGRIDEVAESPEGKVVRDYKSGAIYSAAPGGELTVKSDYSLQLRLYAAILAEATGEWPVRLEVVALDGTTEEVSFDERQCEELLGEAKRLLDTTNSVVEAPGSTVERISQLANPTEGACRFCGYRPTCPAYRDWRGGDVTSWPRDLIGAVSEIQELGNGRLLLEVRLDREEGTYRVLDLDPSQQRHPALASIVPGMPVGIFNLGRSQGPTSFREGAMTTIYRFGDSAA